ncbi:MAG: DUF2283 domain-containing protein [Ignavibacteriales bacterium]|nr:DUF2283 domain-containing protein [Ignavibacteriales bacterium]
MKIIYDTQTDTMNVIFREEQIKESDEVKDGVIVDYGIDGNIIGFEVLDATKHTTQLNTFMCEITK